jgi:hypothetical protein
MPRRMIGRHLLLLVLLAAFFVLEFAYPRFPDEDTEIFFKSAGRTISQGGAFAAPEVEGYLHLDPPIERVYFAQPPLYTWLFGQWTHVVGFGWGACVGYDALISATLAFVVYVLAGAVAGALLGPLAVSRRTVLALAPALLTLVFRRPARIDELGMVLGFTNVWWLFLARASSPRWPIVSFGSGVLAGLMLCTSVGVFLAFVPFLAALWLLRVGNAKALAPSLATAILGGGIAGALCVTPLFLADPHFYRQLFQNAYENLFSYEITASLNYGWQYSRKNVFIFFATLPVLCVGMFTIFRAAGVRETLALLVAPLAGLVLVFCLRRWASYWWFLQPWLMLLAIVVTADLWCRRSSRLLPTVLTGWLAVWLAAAAIWPAKDYLVRITLSPEQSLTTNVQKLRELIPKGTGVLTVTGWWALGNDRAVYDPTHSDIENLSRIDYFVTDSNGTGQPGVWRRPPNERYDTMVLEDFEVVSDTLPRLPVKVLGLRITNSAYGFGMMVLRRRPAQLQN